MRLCAIGVFLLSATGLIAQSTQVPWGYQGKIGPLGWGRLDPAYQLCSKGKEQSPIDIRHARLNKALQPIEFHYKAGSVTLVNNGATVVALVNPGSYIVAGGTRFELKQFEFHHPSESAVEGKLTDMGVELLHKSANGKMAIVEVRLAMDRGSPNAVLAMLWPHLPQEPGATEKVTTMVNPGGFLPADRGYWTYTGSLPTPPCTEGVQWFVFEQEITLSLEQLQAFTRIFRMNSRPLQDPHGRRIEANE